MKGIQRGFKFFTCLRRLKKMGFAINVLLNEDGYTVTLLQQNTVVATGKDAHVAQYAVHAAIADYDKNGGLNL